MDEFSYEPVWPHPSEAARSAAVDFWLAESALPKGKAFERAEQLVLVCRDPAGSVAAVSTVIPSFVASLGLRCFYFRAFVGQAYRTTGLRGSKLIYHLIRKSYDVLNSNVFMTDSIPMSWDSIWKSRTQACSVTGRSLCGPTSARTSHLSASCPMEGTPGYGISKMLSSNN